jgi:hypothetical protein
MKALLLSNCCWHIFTAALQLQAQLWALLQPHSQATAGRQAAGLQAAVRGCCFKRLPLHGTQGQRHEGACTQPQAPSAAGQRWRRWRHGRQHERRQRGAW